MRSFKRIQNRAFTLVELMIVVAIVAVLAVLAGYGVYRYLRAAKTTEAREALGRIAKDASSAYDRDSMAGTTMPLGGTRGGSNQLCPNAGNTVPPAGLGDIRGLSYQSDPDDWADNAGWTCLRFAMKDPQRYMYNYQMNGVNGSTVGDQFVATANGDLNGDDIISTFTLGGVIQQGSSGTLVLTIHPNIIETDPEE